MLTFGHVAEQLGRSQVGLIFTRESPGENRISPELKQRFGGMLIANEGFNQETAQQAIASGEADAVAFGKDFISNPDLPAVLSWMWRSILMTPLHSLHVVARGPAKGFTDYQKNKNRIE